MAGGTKTAGARPKKHRASVRRDKAQSEFVRELGLLALPPWARLRLTSPPFASSARAEDYEALLEVIRARELED